MYKSKIESSNNSIPEGRACPSACQGGCDYGCGGGCRYGCQFGCMTSCIGLSLTSNMQS